jgi:hypothetical protein
VRGAGLQPSRLHQVAWAASGALTVDAGTSPTELASLAGVHPRDVEVLPARAPAPDLPLRFATAETSAALAAAGLSCSR